MYAELIVSLEVQETEKIAPQLQGKEQPGAGGGEHISLGLAGLENETARLLRSETRHAFLFQMTLFHDQLLSHSYLFLLLFCFSAVQFLAGESFQTENQRDWVPLLAQFRIL